MSHPSKRKGYDLEVKVRDILQPVFPGLERTGSLAYKDDAPDLERKDPMHGKGLGPILIVATQDKRGDILVTTSIHTFCDIVYLDTRRRTSTSSARSGSARGSAPCGSA